MARKRNSMRSVAIRKRKNSILIIIILISLVGTSYAEPTKTVRYLMSEPATMFDLGMFRLEQLMGGDNLGSGTVGYDWESNKIQIHVMIVEWMEIKRGTLKKKRNKEDAYELVSIIVNSIRTELGVNYQTGKIFSGFTFLEDCFTHANGRTGKNEPKNFKEELFNMTEISVRFSGEKVKVNAKASLTGTEIYFAK